MSRFQSSSAATYTEFGVSILNLLPDLCALHAESCKD